MINERYNQFVSHVCPLENMIIDDRIVLVKFWFSIDAIAQKNQILNRIIPAIER